MKYLLLILPLLVLPAGCIVYHDGDSSDVEYLVLGDPVPVEITYLDEAGDTLRTSTSQRPWSHAFVAPEGHPLYLHVRIGSTSGSITAAIQANGRMLDVVNPAGAGSEAAATATTP